MKIERDAKKKNIYMCHECGHGYVTQDGDASCTPFMSKCRNVDCNGHAQSFFYMAPQEFLADIKPALVWTKEIMGETALTETDKAGGES